MPNPSPLRFPASGNRLQYQRVPVRRLAERVRDRWRQGEQRPIVMSTSAQFGTVLANLHLISATEQVLAGLARLTGIWLYSSEEEHHVAFRSGRSGGGDLADW